MSHRRSAIVAFTLLFIVACKDGGGGPKGSDASVKRDSPSGDAGNVSDLAGWADTTDSAARTDTLAVSDVVSLIDSSTGPDVTGKPDSGTPTNRDGGADSTVELPDVIVRQEDGAVPDLGARDLVTSNADTLVPADPKNTLYVALDGNDSNPGTKDQPLATIKKAASLATPGTLIYVRGGKYAFSESLVISNDKKYAGTMVAGTAENPIRLWAYPGEAPELDFKNGGASLGKGLSIDLSYWHVKGLIVENSAGRGIQVSAGTGITIEACTTRYNGDMGLVVSNGASYATILNCDSHHQFSAANGGENADGFGAKSNVGPGVVFRGCRAYNNADDGWDLYGAPSAVRLENCWAYRNGDNYTNASTFNGDGNAFKLGHSAGDLAHHVVVNCLAWGNFGANGFEDNNNTGGLSLFNNIAYKNKGAGFEAINVIKHIVKNNISLLNGKPDKILAGSEESNNSWNSLSASEADFLSVDDSVAVGPRQPDGSLPASDFLHLKPSSAMIDKGVDVKLPFLGEAPDLGAYEAK